MAKKNNDISVLWWMFALFVMAIPCIGLVMVLIWASTGENETRKNYFRALIIWFVIGVIFWTVLITLGYWPQILHQFQYWQHSGKT